MDGSAVAASLPETLPLEQFVQFSARLRRDIFIMPADVEDALHRPVDFLVRSDVVAMKNAGAKDLILASAVVVDIRMELATSFGIQFE